MVFPQTVTPLVVIIPFIKKQIPRLRDMLSRWSKIDYAPLDDGMSFIDEAKTDLIFFYNKGPNEVEEQINKILDELGIRKHFVKISFLYADLSEKDDVYPIATTRMFYRVIKDEELRQKYKYFFYMEPDTLTVRKGWMQALHNIAFNQKPFFSLGSINRGNFVNIEPHRMHINGNALYSFSDEHLSFLNELKKNVFFVFDLDPYMYMLSHYDALIKYWHQFIFDDIIMNMYKTGYSEKQLVLENPKTFFVHGGWQV
ncbi:ribosomal protein L11 methyltransferase [Acrasis kona]|uniref:Ribosomal protein L11 methyltransferase n=1 Tax=Acrasis kona TaxID=1008807 RepID=A0AAW2YV94_9EUKA